MFGSSGHDSHLDSSHPDSSHPDSTHLDSADRLRNRTDRLRIAPRLAAAVMAGSLLFSACTDDEPERTDAELLSELEGRELSAAELAQREQIAQTLCRLDDRVLTEIWNQLSAQQLEFQDFVFSRACENRSQLYAEATGRFAVTSE